MRQNMASPKPGKNCHNCRHLEWVSGDIGDPEGWCCNNRQYDTIEQESRHLAQLESESYRLKGKRCCELKDGWDAPQEEFDADQELDLLHS